MNVIFPHETTPPPGLVPLPVPQPSNSGSLFDLVHRIEQLLAERRDLEIRLSVARDWLRAIEKAFPETNGLVATALQEI